MTTYNAYWDAVKNHVDDEPDYLMNSRTVGSVRGYRTPSGQLDVARWVCEVPKRDELVRQFAWTITDPDTVDFVTDYATDRVVDPLAGTGYWAKLLMHREIDVVAYDLNPPSLGSSENIYHRDVAPHWPVLRAKATDVVVVHSDRTLLLSWPPYNEPLGAHVLVSYPGDRVIYVGEEYGGCCGDDTMFEILERDWHQIDDHVPVQWHGIHDVINVYERVNPHKS